jgi:hypothetical protein
MAGSTSQLLKSCVVDAGLCHKQRILLATAQLLQSCPELYELEAQGCANPGLELANAFGVRRMLEMPQEARPPTN